MIFDKKAYQKQWFLDHRENCLDCNILISYKNLRCKPCETKRRWREGEITKDRFHANKTSFKKGQHSSLATEFKKVENVGYAGLHKRIRNKLGTPKKCSFCKTESAKFFDWANISHQYKHDLNDWIRLCRKCHIHYDKGVIDLKGAYL